MTILISPPTPVVVTQTTSTTFTSFTVTNVNFDLNENTVSLTVDKTDTNGIITTDNFTLSGQDFLNYVSTAASSTDTLDTVGTKASTAAVKTRYSISS